MVQYAIPADRRIQLAEGLHVPDHCLEDGPLIDAGHGRGAGGERAVQSATHLLPRSSGLDTGAEARHVLPRRGIVLHSGGVDDKLQRQARGRAPASVQGVGAEHHILEEEPAAVLTENVAGRDVRALGHEAQLRPHHSAVALEASSHRQHGERRGQVQVAQDVPLELQPQLQLVARLLAAVGWIPQRRQLERGRLDEESSTDPLGCVGKGHGSDEDLLGAFVRSLQLERPSDLGAQRDAPDVHQGVQRKLRASCLEVLQLPLQASDVLRSQVESLRKAGSVPVGHHGVAVRVVSAVPYGPAPQSPHGEDELVCQDAADGRSAKDEAAESPVHHLRAAGDPVRWPLDSRSSPSVQHADVAPVGRHGRPFGRLWVHRARLRGGHRFLPIETDVDVATGQGGTGAAEGGVHVRLPLRHRLTPFVRAVALAVAELPAGRTGRSGSGLLHFLVLLEAQKAVEDAHDGVQADVARPGPSHLRNAVDAPVGLAGILHGHEHRRHQLDAAPEVAPLPAGHHGSLVGDAGAGRPPAQLRESRSGERAGALEGLADERGLRREALPQVQVADARSQGQAGHPRAHEVLHSRPRGNAAAREQARDSAAATRDPVLQKHRDELLVELAQFLALIVQLHGEVLDLVPVTLLVAFLHRLDLRGKKLTHAQTHTCKQRCSKKN